MATPTNGMLTCRECGLTKNAETEFDAYRNSPGFFPDCSACRKAKRAGKPAAPRAAKFAGTTMVGDGYVASRELIAIWDAVRTGQRGDEHPLNLMFLGPSGCGKTAGAEYLASSPETEPS